MSRTAFQYIHTTLHEAELQTKCKTVTMGLMT